MESALCRGCASDRVVDVDGWRNSGVRSDSTFMGLFRNAFFHDEAPDDADAVDVYEDVGDMVGR